MLVASIVIIIQAPKCPSPAPKNWWQKRPFYQISVKSFKDSNSDGNGDLNGVLEKADYLANTVGVGSIGLSPIMKNGDYKNVDESLGTLEDFKKLVAGMHEHEIKVVLELPSENSVEQTNALPDTLKFWLGLGVDGFRVSGTSKNGFTIFFTESDCFHKKKPNNSKQKRLILNGIFFQVCLPDTVLVAPKPMIWNKLWHF